MIKIVFVTLLFFITACAPRPSLEEVKLSKLELNLEEFFIGKTTAYGQLQDRFGKVRLCYAG